MKRVIKEVLPTVHEMSAWYGLSSRGLLVKSYHFARRGILICRFRMSAFFRAQGSLRRQHQAYLNFFSGFWYDPTVDCVAIMKVV